MKKYIVLLLAVIAVLTSCGAETAVEETSAENETTVETAIETEVETEEISEPLEIMDSFNFYRLEAAEQPVFEDGILIVKFTEEDIRYTDSSVFYIGLRSDSSAYSIKATSQEVLYPELCTNPEKHYYNGVALLPSEEIPAGDYKMSVSFEDFICEFDITVK